jgi:hypothetical protein
MPQQDSKRVLAGVWGGWREAMGTRVTRKIRTPGRRPLYQEGLTAVPHHSGATGEPRTQRRAPEIGPNSC